MKVGFIRHNLDCSNKLLRDFWSRRLIAIHFKSIRSKNPEDYDGAGKKAMKELLNWCSSGAIVGAVSRKIEPSRILIGKIEPGSGIGFEEKEGHIFKVVQLNNVKELSYTDYPLLSVQPRGGTISGWSSVKEYIKAIFECKSIPFKVNSLHPSQLEVICYEYLKKEGILDTLLMPIGRSLMDLDIVGINKEGQDILAQVTNNSNPLEVKNKIKRLQKIPDNYKFKKPTLIFFGPKSEKRKYEDVLYISNEDVFDDLSSDSESVYYKMLQRMLEIH